jgi:hypothetical protein
MPVGVEPDPPEVSATIATHDTVTPIVSEGGQLTVVDAERGFTITEKLPELVECVASPL